MGSVDWAELQRNLEATIPVYDKINRFATLGQVNRWRRMVADQLPGDGKILEIGCGPGSFAEIVRGGDLTCLDPIQGMLDVAEKRVSSKRKNVNSIQWKTTRANGEFKIISVCCHPVVSLS